MNPMREIAHRLDPALWVREVLGMTPHAWQETVSAAPRRGVHSGADGAPELAKPPPPRGQWHIRPCLCRAPCRWSPVPPNAKARKRCARCAKWSSRPAAELTTDNVYELELANGSRVLALPGTEDSIRGLTVDAWIVADEAARLDPDYYGRLASDARPTPARAVCDVVHGMEPHRSILDSLVERRSVLDSDAARLPMWNPNLIAPNVLKEQDVISVRMISNANISAFRRRGHKSYAHSKR